MSLNTEVEVAHPPGLTRPRVAVLGLGASGLTTVKNLLEVGFDVTGFERNTHIGGLWHFNPDKTQTSVLRSTVANASKQFCVYSDFPFPDDVPDYASAAQMVEYLRMYAEHNNLHPHFRLGCRVTNVARSPPNPSQWAITIQEENRESTELFDRVVVTTGPQSAPWSPSIPGRDEFGGIVIHSQEFKDPKEFDGKTVVVVGLANTGCDIAVELCGVAKKVYLSHRSGSRVLARSDPPLDHKLTRRRFSIAQQINNALPTWLSSSVSSLVLDAQMRKAFPQLKDEWRLLPAPPLANHPGTINNHIIDKFASEEVMNLGRIVEFTSHGIVTVEEGEIACDAVIFATGSKFNYGFLAPEADPTAFPTPEWDAHPNSQGLQYPRLYRTLFHPHHLDSLALFGPCRGFTFAAFSNADLVSQAIAQLWAGRHPMPSPAEVDRWCDDNYRFSLQQIQPHRIPKVGSKAGEFEIWLNEVAGTQVNEKLGWGWEGWKFWWGDRTLYKLIMDGIPTPFVYRLWEGREGGRKTWEGARAEIYKVNGLVAP